MTDSPASLPTGRLPTGRLNEPANMQWGGRFAGGPSVIMQDINASIGFDRKLWRQDIRGSLAHAAMLAITGIFGMAANSVSKRLRELGIRVALGAQRREVLQAALGRPLKLLLLG